VSTDLALRWAGTAAFLAVAGFCVARLVAAHRAPAGYPGSHRAMDTAHVLMGVGMAAMVSPVGGPLPMAGWQTIFLVMTCWFVGSWWRARRATPVPGDWHGGGLHHAVAAVAMLYMLTAMPAHHHDASSPWLSMGTSGHLSDGAALPAVGWALAGYCAVSAVLLVARTDWRPVPARVPSILLAPRLTATCQATMTLGSGAMLVAMLA
jgi:hypothetical protein